MRRSFFTVLIPFVGLAAWLLWLLPAGGFVASLQTGFYLSPDERVVAIGTTALAADLVPLAGIASPIRTAIVVLSLSKYEGINVVPVGFAAWPSLAAMLGAQAMMFLPVVLLCCIFVLCVSTWLVEKKWHAAVWLVLPLFLLINPSISYYLTRPLFPNLAVALLFVIGGLAWMKAAFRQAPQYDSSLAYGAQQVDDKTSGIAALWIAGAAWAAALAVRPVEAVWLFPAAAALVLISAPASWKEWLAARKGHLLGVAAMGLGFAAASFGAQYAMTSAWLPGYLPPAAVVEAVARGTAAAPSWLDYLVPFGWHPRHMLLNALLFLKANAAWLLAAAILLAFRLRGDWRAWAKLAAFFAAAGLPLMAYYGNYLAFDNWQNVLAFTSSFTRYSLPLVAAAWLGLAWANFRRTAVPRVELYGELVERAHGNVQLYAPTGTIITVALMAITAFFSYQSLAMAGTVDWQLPLQNPALLSYADKNAAVRAAIADDRAVIFSTIGDKWLYPDNAVFQPPSRDWDEASSKKWNAALSSLPADRAPYWYEFCRDVKSSFNASWHWAETWRSPDGRECLYKLGR